MRRHVLLVIAVTLAISGCSGIGLREHVFLDRDAWKADFWKGQLADVRSPGDKAKEVLAVTQAPVHRAIVASVRSICGPTADTVSVEGIHLSRANFHDFVKRLAEDIQHQRYALLSVGQQPLGDPEITLPKLLSAYLSAYFSGNFVDRNGGVYSKPKIGTVITNEALNGLATVALEALIDYEVLQHKQCVYFPVYFTTRKTEAKFLTKDGKIPTLAKVVYRMKQGGASDDKPEYYEFAPLVVSVSESDTAVTQRLAVVRYFGGLTGGGAQALTGLIVRDFGGINAGLPMVLGKLSIGDNETLSKLIDTVVETIGRRLTEAAVSTALGPSGVPPSELRWIVIGASPEPIAQK